MPQILHLNALYPLALVSMGKDVSCVSLYGFCILVTWLTKYGHDHQNWRQLLKEHTWPKTKPRILREPKLQGLDVICSNHFVVKGPPPPLKCRKKYNYLHWKIYSFQFVASFLWPVTISSTQWSWQTNHCWLWISYTCIIEQLTDIVVIVQS